MALSNAERQRAWRERHKGEPRGNKTVMTELATLRARVAEFEAAVTHIKAPVVELTPQARRLRAEMAALRKERRPGREPGTDRSVSAWDPKRGKGVAGLDRPDSARCRRRQRMAGEELA